jgi:hypothetical protein
MSFPDTATYARSRHHCYRKVLTYHDSFAYFQPRYGMMVIGAIQPAGFAEPSPQEVAALIDQLRELQLAGPPDAPGHTEVGMMVEDDRTMARALGEDSSAVATIDPQNTFQP